MPLEDIPGLTGPSDLEEADLRDARYNKLLDRRWRLSNLYRILDKEGQEVTFCPNPVQWHFLANMHYLNTILKARQLGFTTLIQIFMLDACLFNANLRCGVIAHNQRDAKAFFNDKIKYAYDRMPHEIRKARTTVIDSAGELTFSNGSSIRVGTSLRSGTLQYLHVSEYGKICAKYPEKAAEIRSGAFNTLQAGQVIFVESTAEGQEGDFYRITSEALSRARRKEPLTALDFKFHFYPWHEQKEYRLDPTGVTITPEYQRYFERLAQPDVRTGRPAIHLDDAQKAWYVKKSEQQGEFMKREYPSYPEEAFEQAVEGAYYARQLAQADMEGRIGFCPHDPALSVELYFDIGRDTTSIWFLQKYRKEIRFINYFADSGEGLPYYVSRLSELARERGYRYRRFVFPHDMAVKEWTREDNRTRLEIAESLGLKPAEIAPNISIEDGIEASRRLFSRCIFDATNCDEGIRGLRSYRKEWDDKLGRWKDNPYHNWASHPADSFRMFGVTFSEEEEKMVLQERTVNDRVMENYSRDNRLPDRAEGAISLWD